MYASEKMVWLNLCMFVCILRLCFHQLTYKSLALLKICVICTYVLSFSIYTIIVPEMYNVYMCVQIDTSNDAFLSQTIIIGYSKSEMQMP